MVRSAVWQGHNLRVIEDCAQSQGAKYKNRYTGTMGDFGCFILSDKNSWGYGDGGFIITKNYYDYLKVKRLRYYGIETENKKIYILINITQMKMGEFKAR